jgi:hypothetical protein
MTQKNTASSPKVIPQYKKFQIEAKRNKIPTTKYENILEVIRNR